jgi:hypothetical protein
VSRPRDLQAAGEAESRGRRAAVPAASPDPALERKFRSLVAEWKADRRPSSTARDIALHPAYLRIIGIGPAALPLILSDLQKDSSQWFVALYAIAGEDAARAETTTTGAVAAWLKWGKAHGIIHASGI